MKPHLLMLTAAASVLMTMPISAARADELSMTGQPRSYDVRTRPYVVAGYGDARWGMTVDEVKALVAREHPGALASLKDEVDPVDRTRGLAVVVPSLPPAPSAVATVSYVFGARSRGLVAIHVSWLLEGDPAPAERTALVQAGEVLGGLFAGWQWPLFQSTRGRVPGPGAVVLFSGKDEAGGGVELRLDGVALDVERPRQAPEHRPAPPGPARLHLTFVANLDQPDVYRLPAGSF